MVNTKSSFRENNRSATWVESESSSYFHLGFKFSADSEVMAERWGHRVSGTRPKVLEMFHGPTTIGNEARETAMLFRRCQNTAGVVTLEPACSELLLSGSNCPKSFPITESSCHTNVHSLGLLHATSHVESCKHQQPGYLLCYTGLLLPWTVQWWSHFYVTTCIYSMSATIKITPQGKGPAQLTINQWVISITPLTCIAFSLNTCSHRLDSRCLFPLPPPKYSCSSDKLKIWR